MKLYYSDASPFARKCRIVLRLKGLLEQTQEITALPLGDSKELIAHNPISQVPCLVLEDETSAFNSPVICAHLNEMSDDFDIYGSDKLKSIRLEALGDGICEMAVKIRLELSRPTNEQSPKWLQRWGENLHRAMAYANSVLPDAEEIEFNIGIISIACALTYLDFRFPEIEWKSKFANLKSLQSLLESHPFFVETFPS